MFFAVDRNPSAVSQNATTFLSLQDGTVQEGNPFQVRCLEGTRPRRSATCSHASQTRVIHSIVSFTVRLVVVELDSLRIWQRVERHSSDLVHLHHGIKREIRTLGSCLLLSDFERSSHDFALFYFFVPLRS